MMTDTSITIEVDGKTLSAEKGQMLIEVTDANDIYIPRFCYHPKLSVAANCRMCLVEVEKAPKPLPACATPVVDGMVVKTQSQIAIDSQKSVMEFLLINHPLDCPICDQGGECELQDLAMGYGRDVSRYQENKRVVQDKNIGPLVQTDMTRCIHCTRCVRFGEEIAGLRELGATGRGEHMEIGTYIEKSMRSELSGNVIDVCPVGALTSKPFRFSARSWEMRQGKGIAPHDCVGSNLEIHFKGNQIKRVVPAENQAINEVWISDRDRFSYEGLYSDDRLLQPKIKQQGQWQTVSWQEALAFTAKGLQNIKSQYGADKIAALTSASATTEEFYLLQRLLRELGSHHIDHRLRQQDFSHDQDMPLYPSLGCTIAELEEKDAVLLVNSQLRYQQPMLNHRVRKAALKGANVMSLNTKPDDFNYRLSVSMQTKDDKLIYDLAAVSHIINDIKDVKDLTGLNYLLEKTSLSDYHKAIAGNLCDSSNPVLILGSDNFSHPQFSIVNILVNAIANVLDCPVAYITEGANAAGGWLAGAVPHRKIKGQQINNTGFNTQQILNEEIKSLLLFNIEPEDIVSTNKSNASFNHSELTVAFSAYESESLDELSDVIFPIALFSENEGSFINIEGKVQQFQQLVKPMGEIKPGWKILRALADELQIDSLCYNSYEELHASVMSQLGDINSLKSNGNIDTVVLDSDFSGVNQVSRSEYAIDPLLRRAKSLQQQASER